MRLFLISFLVISLFLVYLPTAAHAQALIFEGTWGGIDIDGGRGVAVDGSGNVYVTGFTKSFGVGGEGVFLLKYDSLGNILFQRTWGGSGDDGGRGVAVDGSGNIYVTGFTESFGVGGEDVLLLKYDSLGNILFQQTWGGSGDEAGRGVAVDGSGNVYVTGRTEFGVGSIANVFLLKFDSLGSILFQKTWGGTNYDDGYGVAVDSSGNVYVTGFTTFGGQHVVLLKFDSSGNLLFQKAWGGIGNDAGAAVAVKSSGQVIVTGFTNSFGAGDTDALVLEYDSSGNVLFQQTWGGPKYDEGLGVAVFSHYFYVVGDTNTASPYTITTPSGTIASLTGTVTSPSGTVTPLSGTVTTPAGTVTSPSGSQTYGGSVDSVLLRFTQPLVVGGELVPTSKLEIVAPFATLAGLLVAVTAVVVVKRRRD